jgi:heme exporter protein D
MLKGLDDDWAPLTTNTFREFTNLDFGDYEFVVRAVNSSGQFSREASFRFEIDPPWHQALWFYFLQISIYISLLVSSYFLNRKGIALGLAEKIVTILVVVTFEYINTYLGPVFDEIAGNIAIFAVGLNIMVALVLEPVQQWYERILKFVAQAQKEREDRLEREQLEQKMTNPNA